MSPARLHASIRDGILMKPPNLHSNKSFYQTQLDHVWKLHYRILKKEVVKTTCSILSLYQIKISGIIERVT